MSTAKKLKEDILVSYLIEGGKYTIMTNNEFAVDLFKSGKVELRFENHSYHATLDELPMIVGIKYKQYKIKAYSEKPQKDLETELQRLIDIEDAIQRMYETQEAQEALVTKLVKKHGLKLKPHLPKDSEMFSPKHKERVHAKVSLSKIIDQEMIKSLMKKYPQLGKCFKKDIRVLFSKQEFDKIQKTLPAEVINKIVKYDEIESFHRIDFEEFECNQCGGKYTKKNVCKHCGIAKPIVLT